MSRSQKIKSLIVVAAIFFAASVSAEEIIGKPAAATAPAATATATPVKVTKKGFNKNHHKNIAGKYEKLAADQDAVTLEHKKMLEGVEAQLKKAKDKEWKSYLNDCKKYCKRIIKSSEDLADDYRDFAKAQKERVEKKK